MSVRILTILTLLLLVSLTNVNALEPVPGWESTCHNSTMLTKRAYVDFNGTLYEFEQNLTCPYGCDTGRDICWKWPGDAIPGEYFMLFEIVAVVLLLFGIYRLDIRKEEVKIFDIFLPIFTAILFFTLALQGNNVIDTSTGEAVRIIFVVWLDYGLGGLSLLMFFVSMFKFIQSGVEQ